MALQFLPYMTTTTVTTVAVTTTYCLREGRVMGKRKTNPTTEQPVSPVSESKSTARDCWSQDHTSASCSTEAEKVSTPMSSVEFNIFPLIFTLYFISLSVITSQWFTYVTNFEPIFESYFPIPNHYWSYISLFLVSIKSIFFFTSPITIWWKYLCVFKVWLLVSDLMLKGRWFSLTQNLGQDR